MAFGTVYTFGAFVEAMADEFNAGLGATSIVFGITVFLFFGTAIVSGRFYDALGPTPLVIVGGLLFCSGLIGTSVVDYLWQGYFVYGIGCGLGGGLFVAPLFALAASWFQKYRAVAQGLVATGPGLGTLVLVPLSQVLIEDLGWRYAMRWLAIIAGIAFFFGLLLVKRAPAMKLGNPKLHKKLVIRTGTFWRMSISSVLFSTALIGSLGVIIPFAEAEGIDTRRAGLLLSAIGASSILGRLVLTSFARRLGSVRLFKIAFFGLPIAYGIWLLSLEDYLSLSEDGRFLVMLGFATLLGISYGGFVALMGDVVAHLFGLVGIGSVMGLLFFTAGLGSLIGAPAAGFLADYSDARFLPILVMLIISALGALLLLPMTRHPVRLPTWLGPNGPLEPLRAEASTELDGSPAGGLMPGLTAQPVVTSGGSIPDPLAQPSLTVRPVVTGGSIPGLPVQPALTAQPSLSVQTDLPVPATLSDALLAALRAAPPRVFWPFASNGELGGNEPGDGGVNPANPAKGAASTANGAANPVGGATNPTANTTAAPVTAAS